MHAPFFAAQWADYDEEGFILITICKDAYYVHYGGYCLGQGEYGMVFEPEEISEDYVWVLLGEWIDDECDANELFEELQRDKTTHTK